VTTLPDVRLRPATPADAEAGAAMHRACWREAYGPYADPDRLAERLADTERWTAAWTRQLEVGPPRVLAEADGELVGFAASGPSRGEDPPAPSELYALYTRQAYWSTGLGRRLWEAVNPTGPCFLWVLEDNERGRGFYARQGFEPDGERMRFEDLGAWEVRMVRR
jgi:GNAT superfamily N-acetyltransferase